MAFPVRFGLRSDLQAQRAACSVVALGLVSLLGACASGPSKDDGAQPLPMPPVSAPAPASAQSDALAATGTEYRADPGMQAVLEQLAASGGKPIETLSVEKARLQPTPADAVEALLKKQGRSTEPNALVPGVTSRDRAIPGAVSLLPARIYTPRGRGPFPVVLYFHGGGWVIADKETYDAGARGIAKQANAVVVSVDYRRAPEAKFPAAWDDALAAYRWVSGNARSINGDPRRLAIAGESAGGNLAVATAIAARDAGLRKPAAVLAIYPVAQTGNLNTASYRDSATAKPLNAPMIGWFIDKLLADPSQRSDPRLDLIHARLIGLPPITIINAQIDPLREDGALLAEALKDVGVPVERRMYEGTTHEFFGMAAVVEDAAAAQRFAGERLQRAFGVKAKRGR